MKSRIIQFDPSAAFPDLVELYLDFQDRMFRELEPVDPLPLREGQRESLRKTDPRKKVCRWVALAEVGKREEVIGQSEITFMAENAIDREAYGHVAAMSLEVDRRFRRQGLGTDLLRLLVERAVEQGRVSQIEIFGFQESGWRFCERYGGKMALEGAQSRLWLDQVDWDVLEAWRGEGARRNQARGTKLRIIESVPEEMLEAFVDLYNEIVDAVPLGDLELRERVTPASRRKDEAKLCPGWYTMVSQEADGSLSGLTEIIYDLGSPYRLEQDLTGVRTEQRGRGLAKWLKAEMAFFIRETLPEVKYVNTGTADSNKAMVSINERMGFRRHLRELGYRFDLLSLSRLLSL